MIYPLQEQLSRPTPRKLHYANQGNDDKDENMGCPLAQRNNQPKRISFREIQESNSMSLTSAKRGTPYPKAKSEIAASHSDTDISVTKLKGWLNDFGKSHDSRKPVVTTTATRTKLAVPISKRQDVVIGKGPSKTPVRFKTHFEDVQATDDGYASVKKLASWLADDPTKKKEVVGHVRKGMNVISKSRKFEKELEDVILDDDDDDEGVIHTVAWPTNKKSLNDPSIVSVADKKKWLQAAFPRREEEDVSQNDDDDTSTVVSVTDKKKWLANAFVNKAASTANSCPPVMMQQSIKASAKDKWRQKRLSMNSDRQLKPEEIKLQKTVTFAEIVPKVEVEPAIKMARVDSVTISSITEPNDEIETIVGLLNMPEETGVSQIVTTVRVGWRRPPLVQTTVPKSVEASRAMTCVSHRRNPLGYSSVSQQPRLADTSDPQPEVEAKNIETSPEPVVDFNAARQLIVQRGQKNGNPVMLTKVQMRKAKFEKWEKDLKKGSGTHGRLKSSWEHHTPAVGRPSDSYQKNYVSDIAPKRSIGELP